MVSPTEPQSSRHQKSISTPNVVSLQNLDHAFNRNRWLLMVVLPCKASIKQTSKINIYCQWCLPLEPQSNRHQKSMYIPNNVSLLNLHQVDTRNQCLLSILSPYITSIKKTHQKSMSTPNDVSLTEPQSSRHQKSMSTPNDVSLQKLNQVDTRNQCLLPMMSPYRTSIIQTHRNQCLLPMMSSYRAPIMLTPEINFYFK